MIDGQPPKLGGTLRKRSRVSFEWRIYIGEFDERQTITLTCGNACKQGAPFPQHWKTAVRCTRLAQTAAESVEKLRGKTAVVDLYCASLGLPKPSPLPQVGAEHVAGAAVALRKPNGARHDYLLAAHAGGDQ